MTDVILIAFLVFLLIFFAGACVESHKWRKQRIKELDEEDRIYREEYLKHHNGDDLRVDLPHFIKSNKSGNR